MAGIAGIFFKLLQKCFHGYGFVILVLDVFANAANYCFVRAFGINAEAGQRLQGMALGRTFWVCNFAEGGVDGD
jgi:hypothetical protein